MKTYIINLKECSSRKERMRKILTPYTNMLDISFIEAVNGNEILKKNNNFNGIFNMDKSINQYGRILYPGEVGCTLSHRKCH